ncbi:molybdopterin-dependent oxidoreductase [Seohaeicola saemankumensis]|nr:molybdopterin-dependent oxidoreductase [Seohaeicola saemankumensis]MCA0869678.1 molybdopterin-dependent oxidoreductase [Seohaeicola saemankumensis]
MLLTVTGDFTVKNVDGTAQFDLGMLQALPTAEFETTTIWTDGVMRFTGVPLSALLKHLEIASGSVRAQAINDYSVEIPLDEITEDVPIVAYFLNGEPMSRREKGPLWVVYPYDQDADYRSEIVYSRSIWQLDRIEAVQ